MNTHGTANARYRIQLSYVSWYEVEQLLLLPPQIYQSFDDFFSVLYVCLPGYLDIDLCFCLCSMFFFFSSVRPSIMCFFNRWLEKIRNRMKALIGLSGDLKSFPPPKSSVCPSVRPSLKHYCVCKPLTLELGLLLLVCLKLSLGLYISSLTRSQFYFLSSLDLPYSRFNWLSRRNMWRIIGTFSTSSRTRSTFPPSHSESSLTIKWDI